ncbi:MAG TPA: DUF5011 domain-containing protein [Flavobacterium sp.]|jgi:hypothetical protein
MKNFKKISLLGVYAIVFAFISCSYEPEIGSRVTIYPIVTLNGESLVLLQQGTPYQELGAVSLAGDTELPVTIAGSVDPSTPGPYKVTYSSVNPDGFSVSETRTIIVMSATPSTLNLEGTFFRNGNANNVVRISDRVYTADNAGGLAASAVNSPNFLFVTFYVYDDAHIYIPSQVTPSGITVESISGTIISNNNFRWVLAASSFYGTAVRNFVR